MIPSRVNISSEQDLENMQTQQNENHKQLPSRGPRTAYKLWACHQRRERSLDFQHMEKHEIGRLLSDELAHMTVGERKPFVDKASSLKEQHMRDYPKYKYKSRSRPKSVVKTVDKRILPRCMPSSFSPTFNAQILMPIHGASALNTEARRIYRLSYFPPDRIHSTTHPYISSYYKTQCAVSGNSTSIASHNAQIYVTNRRASTSDRANRNNVLAGCIPTYHTYSTTHPYSTSDSNTQCAVKGTSTSMAFRNAQSQEDSSFQHRFTSLRLKNSRQDLNPSESVHSNSSSSSLTQSKFPDSQYHTQEYPLDLSVRKDP